MFIRIIFIGFIITLLICCDKAVPEPSLLKDNCGVDLNKDEIEVTSLVVSKLLKKGFPEGKTATIVRTTLLDYKLKDITEILKANSQNLLNNETAMIEDFESKNRIPLSFDNDVLILPHKYEFISQDEFAKISKVDPYTVKSDPLKKQFPNSAGLTALVGFSRIGFNKDFSKAILYGVRWSEYGSFFLLEKNNCEWQIKKEQLIWVH